MEMDRLASPSSGIPGLGLGPDDPMSDSGIISAPENILSIRNKRGMCERIVLHFLTPNCKFFSAVLKTYEIENFC